MFYRWNFFMFLSLSIFIYSCTTEINEADNSMIDPIPGPRTVEIDLSEYQAVYYVADDLGNDGDGDGSKEKPWASINHALNHIPPASDASRIAILVSAGDYSKATIMMKEFVDLYGGFSPASWLRDIERFPSILSGDDERRVLIAADNSRLDGFIITSGLIRGKGAAILCEGVSPLIKNNIFTLNKTLGPLDWNPKYWHETANDGGAIYVMNNAAPVIEHNLFVKNRTENGRGAAIAFDGHCKGDISFNVFTENVAGLNDPMRSSDGGAVSIFNWCNVKVENNLFIGNRAESDNDGGALFVALWSSAKIQKNGFVDNYSGDDAGAIFVGGQEHRYDSPLDPIPPPDEYYVSITDNYVIGNRHSRFNSGAMRFTMEARGEFRNNVVAHSNGIYFQRSEVDVINNTILENFLYIENKEGLKPGRIANNIIWGDFILTMNASLENNVIRNGDPYNRSLEREPDFLEDQMEIFAAAVSYHQKKHFTTISLLDQPMIPGELSGRVVRAGNRWSIIRSNDERQLTIWRNFSGELVFHILPTYRLN